MLFYFLVRWEDTHDWLASLAVIGCLCMEAILGDTVFSIHFIGSVISCVYKIFGVWHLGEQHQSDPGPEGEAVHGVRDHGIEALFEGDLQEDSAGSQGVGGRSL